jgi:Ni,Fe-hydrogenase I cytochrome b subunit
MAATGLVLAFEDVEWLRPVHNAAKQIHGVLQLGMYGFIIIDLTGVIRADITKYGGIVSRMINGKN